MGESDPRQVVQSEDSMPDCDVVERYFAGDRRLYESYAGLCRTQFLVDIATGDVACAAADLRALERLGHNLKTVLQSLGREALSGRAADLESAAHRDALEASLAAWRAMRVGMASLLQWLPEHGDSLDTTDNA